MENGSPDRQLIEFPFRELTVGKARRNIRWLCFIFSVYLLTVCYWTASGQSQYKVVRTLLNLPLKLRENGLLNF